MQPTLQDNQPMSKHRVLSFKPQLRLEWRGQDGQNETKQPDHSASLGDSITSSTRIRFSVHTVAKFQLGADAEAVTWLRRSIDANRNFPVSHFILAAALGLLGALDEARTAAGAGLALDSGFTIRRLRAIQASGNPTYVAWRERYFRGLRLAGVPEG
jgi:hypothetical protein